jgi:hypothetical protein
MDTTNCFQLRVRASIQRNHKTFSVQPSDGSVFDRGAVRDGRMPRSILGIRRAIILTILAATATIASPAFAQSVAGNSSPRAVMIVSGGPPRYLRVDDCISHLPCRQLSREQSVTVNDRFMFFSILSTGIDVKARHRIFLKIAGFTIPDTIATLVREDARTQRIYFFVDIHRFERVPAANSSNIDISVDDKIITARGDR